MTLIEIMIVLSIVGMAMGAVALSYRAIAKATARSSASKLAAAIRYLYDQSIVTGAYYRLSVDLGTEDQPLSSYKAERSDERFFLRRDKENAPGRGKAFDADAERKQQDEDDKRIKDSTQGLAAQLQPPPTPKRARFETFKDAMLPTVEMRGVYIRDIYTPRQNEPYIEGKAYLYYFPDGHTEHAVIHVVAGKRPRVDDPLPDDTDIYTLVLHPLTGRLELLTGDRRINSDFDSTDEEGQTEAGH